MVECGRLLIYCAVFCTEGSNPSSSLQIELERDFSWEIFLAFLAIYLTEVLDL